MMQEKDEVNFKGKVEELLIMVEKAMIFTDLTKVKSFVKEVEKMWKSLKSLQEEGLLLNNRQKLLGLAVTPFVTLTEIMKQFEPYLIFWTTVAGISKFKKLK